MSGAMLRAFVSVSDKRNLVEFCRGVSEGAGLELVATGGTYQSLVDGGLGASVVGVETVTSFPELLDGRVKSLHPNVFAGVLARTFLFDDGGATADGRHVSELAEHGIAPVPLVACNLYDFGRRPGVEQIDVGGAALLRAAAKNYEHVIVVSDPADYEWVARALRRSGRPQPTADARRWHWPTPPLTLSERRSLAAKAFAMTADYDRAISSWLSGSGSSTDDTLPPRMRLDAELTAALRYGENPHQRAALYSLASDGGAPYTQLPGGKELSYNNILDVDSALDVVDEWQGQRWLAAALVKHNTPCGVAARLRPRHDAEHSACAVDVFQQALASDPVSAFGGVLALNCRVDVPLVDAIGSLFLEVIVAPDFCPDAVALLQRKKKNCRLIQSNAAYRHAPLAFRSVRSGLLVQSPDTAAAAADTDTAAWRCVSKTAASPEQLADLEFAWRAAKYVKSNGIVVAKHGATVGIGSGQPNRVSSVHLALRFAGARAKAAVLASDAFFPFADSIDMAAHAGIAAIVETGGSIRDDEVIAAADRHNIPLYFTGIRHFRH